MKRLTLFLAAAALVAVSSACGSSSAKSSTPAAGATASSSDDIPTSSGHVTLHLGYFPNVTHAQPIVGLARGTFQQALGANVTLDTKTFNAGGDEITALFAGAIDIGYIGPSPAVNGFVKSKGDDVRIIAGAVSGGAALDRARRRRYRDRRRLRQQEGRDAAARQHAGRRAADMAQGQQS